jgi:basic amino acid/polyamine antiporter, APA family
MNNLSENNTTDKELIRGVTLKGATALNMIDMIGVGPFITIPLIIAAMNGPQAMVGWIFGAMLALSDGLVWAELGAAFPKAGGSYQYLKEIYGKEGLGKYFSFLFIFQLSFSAPLSIASGCIGLAMYFTYLFPSLGVTHFNYDLSIPIPVIGAFEASLTLNNATFLAFGTLIFTIILLYRKITIISKFSQILWGIVIITVLWIIISGITHFNPSLAFNFPSNAFSLDKAFFLGLGSAMLISVYDYWGYYNVCFFGGEVKEPGKNIPLSIIYAIIAVAVLYIVMNISILGVLPWQEVSETANSDARKYIVSVFMDRIWGNWAGILVTILIGITAFSSVYSLLLGYSRVPYAASVQGDYFKIFSKLHTKNNFPNISLIILGVVAGFCCLLRLKDIIAALVVIRIIIQFLAQTIGVVYFRIKKPDFIRPFKMWLFPLPAIISLSGFVYVLISRNNFMKEIRYAAFIIIIGSLLFWIRSVININKSQEYIKE